MSGIVRAIKFGVFFILIDVVFFFTIYLIDFWMIIALDFNSSLMKSAVEVFWRVAYFQLLIEFAGVILIKLIGVRGKFLLMFLLVIFSFYVSGIYSFSSFSSVNALFYFHGLEYQFGEGLVLLVSVGVASVCIWNIERKTDLLE